MLVDHLADAGHREAVFVKCPEELYAAGSTYANRFASSARERAEQRGLRLVPISVPVGPEQVRATLRAVLQDPENPRALLIHNDAAVAMLPFALHDLGLEVPADRSVVSLHAAELARLYVLSFTSVESEPVAVCQTAVEMLAKRIASPDSPVQKRLIVPHIEAKGSVQAAA
jgi:DNA-binding LacI/PurR family transcriptional regulator